MLYNLLADPMRTVGVGEASLYALMGFMLVFVGIAFLIFVVWLVGKIMTTFENRPKKDKNPKQETAMEPVVEEDELSEETIAVIMGALMAYYQTNNPKCEFKVKRIKRI